MHRKVVRKRIAYCSVAQYSRRTFHKSIGLDSSIQYLYNDTYICTDKINQYVANLLFKYTHWLLYMKTVDKIEDKNDKIPGYIKLARYLAVR